MRKIILDEHTDRCKNQNQDNPLYNRHLFCKMNPSKFLFFYDRQFVYLEIPNCKRTISNNLTFLENLLMSANKETKRLDKYKTYRSRILDGEFREHRLRCKELDLNLIEVNYCYSDATGKEYALCTDITLDEALKPNDDIKKDAEEMKKFLEGSGNSYLIDTVDELVRQNWYHISDYEIMKTSEHLIKELKRQIKNK